MTNTRAEAFAPASMANLGVGFDILGLALGEPGDRVIAEKSDTPGVTIHDIFGDGGKLPRAADKNTASVAAQSILKAIDAPHGVSLTILKDLPLASGLGSSAASAVAAAVAVNALFGSPLARHDLLPACLDGEALVSGYHADNVAPCLFGGITLISGTNFHQIRQLPSPENLHLALVTPNVAVPTAEARAVLPQMVPLKAMIAQTSAIAQLIDALYRADIQAIGEIVEYDSIIEPARAHLMPLLHEVRVVAKRAGAYGLTISGAGPTLCAFCDSHEIGVKVAAAMQAVYDNIGIGATSRCTIVRAEGAEVMDVATVA
jgi:homoserine kinase